MQETRKRVNVMSIARMMCILGGVSVLAGLVGAIFVVGDEHKLALLALTVGGAINLAMGLQVLAKDIIAVDSEPFDASEAAHRERMKQLELDHAHRNGQNEAMLRLIDLRPEAGTRQRAAARAT